MGRLSILFALLLFASITSPLKCLSNFVDKFKLLKEDGYRSQNIPSREYKITSVPNKPRRGILQSSKVPSNERIQKYIARAGICSRRKAEKLIQEGNVYVNGKVVTEMGLKVNPKLDKVVVSGNLVTPVVTKQVHWIMLNKPKGVVTTMGDDKHRQTIYDLIPKAHDLRLVPIGRLSRNSTGLLLLTNEIEYIHRLTHPSFPISQRCELTVTGIPSNEALLSLNHQKIGPLSNELYPRFNVVVKEVDYTTDVSILDVQSKHLSSVLIKSIVDSLGCKLVRSKRTEFGPLRLNRLKRGEWRILLPAEVSKIKFSTGKC